MSSIEIKQRSKPDRREYFRNRQRIKRNSTQIHYSYWDSPKVVGALTRFSTAEYDPVRDGLPVHESHAAALLGDPPIGRRAIDQRQDMLINVWWN